MSFALFFEEGRLEAVDPFAGERYGGASLGPGQFYGELSILSGGATMLASRAVERSKLLAVPRDALLRLMSLVPEMSDIIVTVFAARRRRLLESNQAPLTLIGAEKSRELRQIAAFATGNRIPVRMMELKTESARNEAKTCSIKADEPAVLFGQRLIEDPTPSKIAKLLGLDIEVRDREVFDVPRRRRPFLRDAR